MRCLQLFIAWLIILMLSTQGSADARGWALLIGINDYSNPMIRDLRGCETDVQLMADVLKERFGFAESDMKMLRSGEATHDNIVQSFREWLIAKPQPGDVVVFYFSGHGAQVVDEDGDEPDGWDELLCPADLRPTMDRSQYENPLLDDELNELLSQIPTDNVTVILDSCHSGTGTKSLIDAELSYPKAIPKDLLLVPKKPRDRPVTQRETISVEQVDANHVLISGSAAEEVSIDAMWHSPVGDVFYAGVLTKNLVEALRQATEATSYADLMNGVRQGVRERSRQTPQLEGDTTRPIFSVRNTESGDYATVVAVPEKPFFHVTRLAQNTAFISAGSVLGVTKGSIYDIFSPTEASFVGDPLARLQITSVDLHEASGEMFDSRFTIQQLCRVVASNYAHPTGQLALRLQFEGSSAERASLEGALSRLSDVALAQPGHYADLVFDVTKQGFGFQGVLTAADGTELRRTTSPSIEGLVGTVKPSVEDAVVKKWLTGLKNPNPPFKIKVWMDKSNPVYRIGEVATFKFTAERDCYLTLLDVDTQGHVTMLFPNKYHPDNRIVGNRIYTIPSDEMKFRIRAQGPPGRELVKAIATTEPIRLPGLDMEAIAQSRDAFLDVGGSAGVRSITTALGRAFVVEKKEEPELEPTEATSAITNLPTSKYVTSELFAEILE